MNENLHKVLFVINNNSNLSQREIASMAGLSVGTINSVIKNLIKMDYIKVEKSTTNQRYIMSEKGLSFLEGYLKGSINKKIITPPKGKNKRKQAVILAAGERLDFKKPVGFLSIGEETIVERMIQLLNECGIQEIIIIVGYESQYYEKLAQSKNNIILVKNESYRWNGTMASLALAKEHIKDDFILIESDLVFEKKALLELLNHKSRNCLLITDESGSEDEVYVEIRDQSIYKMSKDKHQFNKIDGELIGISKISKDILDKMLEEFETNENPYFSYEYALLDVSMTYSIGFVKLDDLIWTEIDTKWHYKNLINYIYPMLLEKELL